MKVLVTGASGQLGSDLVKILSLKHEVIGLDRKQLDITNLEQCRKVIAYYHPDTIIHAAAYTAVDLAETEVDRAYEVNAYGTRNIALAAEQIGAKVCYISTDYVFDGTKATPYFEYDQTNPQSVYGSSKRAGEQLLASLCSRYFIVRTSWVYGKHGHNFVKTMLRLAQERDSLQVVNDQTGSPTYTVDLSYFLMELVQSDQYGIYHASNTGSCTWYEFAKQIFEWSGHQVSIQPVTSEQFPQAASRPRNSVLEHMSIRVNGFNDLRHWREGLSAFLEELGRGS